MPRKSKTEEEKKEELTQEEIENLILDLAKQGLTSEKIGLKLKEQKIGKTKISEILKKHSIFQDPDISNLKKKVEKLKKHLSKHKHDYRTQKTLLEEEGKVRRLEKYRA